MCERIREGYAVTGITQAAWTTCCAAAGESSPERRFVNGNGKRSSGSRDVVAEAVARFVGTRRDRVGR